MENSTDGMSNHAITTYGKDNHAVVANGFRYIQYNDGSEELYDRSQDPNEWDNNALKKAESEKDKFQHLLPNINEESSPKTFGG